MWLIASIPFWMLGAAFLLAAIAHGTLREPNDTMESIVRKFIQSLLFAGVFFIIAAKIAS